MKKTFNKRDIFVQLLKEIAQELGIEITFFSQNWIVRLAKNECYSFIMSYNLGLNSDATSQICADKTATSMLLKAAEIPCIEHQLFHLHRNFQNGKGNWQSMLEFFEQHNRKIVLKSNKGSGGTSVALVRDLYQLEIEVYSKLNKRHSICLAPFENIKQEYRIVMLEDEPQLIFGKTIPKLIGNGEDTVQMLLNKYFEQQEVPLPILEYLNENQVAMQHILPVDETVALNWKHNLSGGAAPMLVTGGEKAAILIKLAKQTARALNLKFASVDIIETEEGAFKVLEVNSGVMLINFAMQSAENYAKAKAVYKKAVQKLQFK